MSENAVIVGHPSNFWLWTETEGFDLTHPATPNSLPIYPRIKFQTVTSPVTITPTKTAMVIIDMQNYFLSAALGRPKGEGLKAEAALLEHAIPAARKAGIRIIWLNWGLTEESLKKAPPAMYRAFGFQKLKIDERASLSRSETAHGTSNSQPQTVNQKKANQDIGVSLGKVTLEDGTNIEAGLMLMRDQWNTALHPPLDAAYRQGLETKVPDMWFHKDRPTGLWGGSTECEEFLEAQGIRTLLFAGVNADQCVLSTLQDANSKGFDCILLRDCSGTTSPEYAGLAVEFNCANTWGFMSSGERLAEGVDNMETQSG
ncbi:hypothetical protein H2198_001419 [Neophaeococcomyces mojaviensis]|uniref:Uncharacterized protein n=1 Tax=Neophaeococcomyces mojaviensis TaxID=3383035 RepID=A0ACC3AHF4_9EURO|nr:hypothetical protein H2198_001419 [Knufia sp. JES_112]